MILRYGSIQLSSLPDGLLIIGTKREYRKGNDSLCRKARVSI